MLNSGASIEGQLLIKLITAIANKIYSDIYSIESIQFFSLQIMIEIY